LDVVLKLPDIVILDYKLEEHPSDIAEPQICSCVYRKRYGIISDLPLNEQIQIKRA
jgi:hypothetical protein